MRIRRIIFVQLIISIFLALQASPTFAQSSGIVSPVPGSPVSGDVIIVGTATHPAFDRYDLYWAQGASPPGDAYQWFANGTAQVSNGPLGIWRTGGLTPGVYSLRLRVVKTDSNYDEYYLNGIIVGGAVAPAPAEATPTETPTVTPTDPFNPPTDAATPIPTFTFTPAPTPTPGIGAVSQPAVDQSILPTETPTPQAVAVAADSGAQPQVGVVVNPANASGSQTQASSDESQSASIGRAIGTAFAMERLREQFWNGVRYSAAICLAALAIYGGKFAYGWSRRRFR